MHIYHTHTMHHIHVYMHAHIHCAQIHHIYIYNCQRSIGNRRLLGGKLTFFSPSNFRKPIPVTLSLEAAL